MALKVVREEGGFRALYRGLVPTALGIVSGPFFSSTFGRVPETLFNRRSLTVMPQAPYNGINFAAYEYLKELICPPAKPEKHTTPRRLATGALAGGISQTLTYPLDVLRRKSQLASAKG